MEAGLWTEDFRSSSSTDREGNSIFETVIVVFINQRKGVGLRLPICDSENKHFHAASRDHGFD